MNYADLLRLDERRGRGEEEKMEAGRGGDGEEEEEKMEAVREEGRGRRREGGCRKGEGRGGVWRGMEEEEKVK